MGRHTKALTLVELLIAVVLLVLVVMGFTSLDFFSLKQVIDSDHRIKIQNELAYVLEDISKNVIRSTGSVALPGVQVSGAGVITVRVQYNNNTIDTSDDDINTPANYTDDTLISYYQGTAGGANQFRIVKDITRGVVVTSALSGATSTTVMLSRDLIPAATTPPSFEAHMLNNGTGIALNITGSLRPALTGFTDTNPTVVLRTQVVSHSAPSE